MFVSGIGFARLLGLAGDLCDGRRKKVVRALLVLVHSRGYRVGADLSAVLRCKRFIFKEKIFRFAVTAEMDAF